MSNSGNLRPAWKGGRGFQPPPTVSAETRARSSSIGGDGNSTRASNKFSALQDDDDFQVVSGKKTRNNNSNNNENGDPKTNSRGEAFRSSFGPGGRSSKPGRSLADLAARVPEGIPRAQSTGAYAGAGGPGVGVPPPGERRFSEMRGRSGSSGDPAVDAMRSEPSEYKKAVEAAKVIRYTREKLMAIRPRPVMGQPFPPPHLAHVDATVLFSEEPQDPVCWDTLDADEIWATVPVRRTTMPMPKGGPPVRVSSTGGLPEEGPPPEGRRRSYVAPSSGRWQRGQALPPSEEGKRGKDKDANSPDDLWDDPVGGATGAAMDFSAFGGMPQGDLKSGEGGSVGSAADAFDFDKMAEATKKFEEEFRGTGENGEVDEDDPTAQQKIVDPKRPLATQGTTIRSGSGEDVNVFEDFDAPGAEGGGGSGGGEALPPQPERPATQADVAGIKGVEEDPSASSRLMAMIGVKKDDGILGIKSDGSWNGGAPADGTAGLLGLGPASSSTAIPLNPWGDPILPTPPQPTQQQNVGIGMDLASRLESFAAEQKAREAAEMEQKELLRRRQEQEEQQRRAMQQQQAQDRARQQAQYNQNQNPPPQNQNQQQPSSSSQSQVELVLMERITTILENSWGRSDLISILSTLHAEDSRVIPLLSNVDLLRDLIAHNPRRVALRQDQAFGAEMAVLQMTNVQYQQHEQQVRAQQQQQQEELRRREEQVRLENIQRQRSMSSDGPPRVNPEAPWFYSDPQGNIQGPFRGDEMRQWLEAGYFKGDLPISQQAGGPFIALSAIFPQIEVAFKVQQPDRAQEEAEARARADEERMMEERRMEERRLEEHRMEERRLEERRLEEQRLEELRLEEERRQQEHRCAEEEYERQRSAEEQARKEQETREAVEREREANEAAAAQQAAAAAADNSNGANQSSTQLKMMLGLSSSQQAAVEELQSVEKQAPMVDAKNNNNSNNNNQRRAKEPTPEPQAPAPPPKPAASAWGNAAQKTTNTRKSMSEIQKEEGRRAAVVAMQQGSPTRQSSSGWANVAATGGGAWAPGAVKPVSAAAAVVAGGAPPAVVPGGRLVAQPAAARAKATVMRKGSAGVPQQRGSPASTTAAEEFGASMSPTLENWCKDSMKKLNGTDDLTLVSFCMTLNDAVEIRQYLTTYLGSTPAVNTFATEFIIKKGGGVVKEEEWATPGSAKKGRKKKGAAAATR